jgi:AcrR family transcriptional regulator
MATPRRLGAEDSTTRAALLDAALALMAEEGYAAVTSRKVAAKAGLKPQLVHYYFRTMDDLFIALVRQGAEQNLERQARALASAQPLRALWAFSADPAGARLATEFSALANHRPVIRTEWARFAEEFRRREVAALGEVLAGYGVDPDELPAEAVMVLFTAVARMVEMEVSFGMTAGHAETRAVVERLLTRYEGPPAPEG